jgi:hypothetical protein
MTEIQTGGNSADLSYFVSWLLLVSPRFPITLVRARGEVGQSAAPVRFALSGIRYNGRGVARCEGGEDVSERPPGRTPDSSSGGALRIVIAILLIVVLVLLILLLGQRLLFSPAQNAGTPQNQQQQVSPQDQSPQDQQQPKQEAPQNQQNKDEAPGGQPQKDTPQQQQPEKK